MKIVQKQSANKQKHNKSNLENWPEHMENGRAVAKRGEVP